MFRPTRESSCAAIEIISSIARCSASESRRTLGDLSRWTLISPVLSSKAVRRCSTVSAETLLKGRVVANDNDRQRVIAAHPAIDALLKAPGDIPTFANPDFCPVQRGSRLQMQIRTRNLKCGRGEKAGDLSRRTEEELGTKISGWMICVWRGASRCPTRGGVNALCGMWKCG